AAVRLHLKTALPPTARSAPPRGPSGGTPALPGEERGRHTPNAARAPDPPPEGWSSGSLPRLKHEIRALLQQRLRVFSVVAAVSLNAFLVMILSDRAPSEYQRVGHWSGGPVLRPAALPPP